MNAPSTRMKLKYNKINNIYFARIMPKTLINKNFDNIV